MNNEYTDKLKKSELLWTRHETLFSENLFGVQKFTWTSTLRCISKIPELAGGNDTNYIYARLIPYNG